MRSIFLVLAISSMALGSCQTVADGGPISTNGGLPYKALGTEPFWALEIYTNYMIFDHDVTVVAKDMKATSSLNGWLYTSSNLTVGIAFTPCSDGMSEFTYKDTVTVKAGGRTFQGCGGGIVPPETLEQTQWRMLSINGEIIEPERDAKLSFDGKRMSGSIGCNRLGAEYSFDGKALLIGPVMSTRMACPDPVGAQEYALVTLLGSLQSTDFPGDGTMVLKDKAGGILVLKQTM